MTGRIRHFFIYLMVFLISMTAFGQELVPSVRRGNVSLDEMKYESISDIEVQNLEERILDILESRDIKALDKWIQDYNTLYARIEEMGQLIYLKYQLHTEQRQYFNEYLHCMKLIGTMNEMYQEIMGEDTKGLEEYYKLMEEREKLVELYYNKQDTVTIKVQGKEMGLEDIIKPPHKITTGYLVDRWYTAYNKEAGEIFLKLVQIDNKIAVSRGLSSYVDYSNMRYGRQYTLEETLAFCNEVKKTLPPLVWKIQQTLEPGNSLEKYSYVGEEALLDKLDKELFSKDGRFKAAYDYMKQYHLYDIEPRKNKKMGAFTSYLKTYKEPFISVNMPVDYQTLFAFIHEFGHYNALFYKENSKNYVDLQETYSQALELFALSSYEQLFESKKLANEAQKYTLINILNSIIEGCIYQELLSEIYKNPNLSVEDINALYEKINSDYYVVTDKRTWCEVAHNYERPFYYLSYSISGVVAFEIWEKYLEDKNMSAYFRLLDQSSEATFEETLQKAGLKSPLEQGVLDKIVKSVEAYLAISKEELKNIS